MQKNGYISPLFGRISSIFMKHMNCTQIKYAFINIKNGGSIYFFFSFSKHPHKYLALPDRKPLER